MKTHGAKEGAGHQTEGTKPYALLVLMAALSFGAMYVLMYGMVNTISNARPNLNQLYMAGLMTGAMVLIELAIMRTMYENVRLNLLVVMVAVAALIACFVGIRRQAGIGDEQFLKSMIPHHASAILMCQEATIEDPGIQDLCRRITTGQRGEIEEMDAILQGLDDR